jgi:hypothetical protein
MKNGGRSVVANVSEIEITGRISIEMRRQWKKIIKYSNNNPDAKSHYLLALQNYQVEVCRILLTEFQVP